MFPKIFFSQNVFVACCLLFFSTLKLLENTLYKMLCVCVFCYCWFWCLHERFEGFFFSFAECCWVFPSFLLLNLTYDEVFSSLLKGIFLGEKMGREFFFFSCETRDRRTWREVGKLLVMQLRHVLIFDVLDGLFLLAFT